jgi:hypothetical protein
MKTAEATAINSMTFAPYTEMVEIEVLTTKQREELLASLREADAEEGTPFDASLLRNAFLKGFNGKSQIA